MVDYFRAEIYVGILCLLPFIILRARAGLVGTALWLYCLASAASVFLGRREIAPGLSLYLDQTTGQAFAILFVLPLAVLCIPKCIFMHWRRFFVGLAIIEGILILTNGWGLMIASSFDSALIAAIAPLASWPIFFLLLIPIMVAKGATAIVILFAQGCTYAFRRKELRAWVIAGTLALIAVAALLQGKDLANPSGRIRFWQEFFEWWRDAGFYFTGTGIGTFEWLGPAITSMHGRTQVVLQMHNDYLQMLFEGGIVGLGLLIAFCAVLFKRALHRSTRMLALFVGTLAFGLTYHPLHFFPSALFLACLARDLLNEEHEQKREFLNED
jgi:hypothetical protein